LTGQYVEGFFSAMRRVVLDAILSLLLVVCLSSSVFASGIREVRVNTRPPGIPSNVVRWAYVRGGTLTTGNEADFDRRVTDYVVYVYDPKAPASDARSLSERAERTEKPGGSTTPRPKTRGESAARGLACVAAAASLSSCKGEKGGSPYGIPGGLNPRASSSPAKQAMAAGAVILLTVTDVKQIATAAAGAARHKLAGRAAKEAVEKAALEAAEKAWKRGGKHASREAVERAAEEAAEKAAKEAAEKAAQEAAEQASRRAPVGSAARGAPKLHIGQQGKHIPGYPNYTTGRSVLRADPAKLAKRAGTGTPVNNVPRGQPGFRERVDFGEVIGDFVKDGVATVATPTTKGIIHYGKEGIHIVPSAP
jgi:hypothetical protein